MCAALDEHNQHVEVLNSCRDQETPMIAPDTLIHKSVLNGMFWFAGKHCLCKSFPGRLHSCVKFQSPMGFAWYHASIPHSRSWVQDSLHVLYSLNRMLLLLACDNMMCVWCMWFSLHDFMSQAANNALVGGREFETVGELDSLLSWA